MNYQPFLSILILLCLCKSFQAQSGFVVLWFDYMANRFTLNIKAFYNKSKATILHELNRRKNCTSSEFDSICIVFQHIKLPKTLLTMKIQS
jgi:hypothetical protein